MDVTCSNDQYEEIERLIDSKVKEVRLILKEKHNFIIPEQCNEFLIRCVRVKDGNVEKAVKLILAFHSTISDILRWNVSMRPSAYKKYYRSGVISPLKQRDSSGRLVYINRMGWWDHKSVEFDQAICCMWMLGQYNNAELLEVQRQGAVVIYDFSDFTLQQAWAVKQWRLPFLARINHNGVGGRIKAFHIVNHPRVVNAIYAGLKPFLSEKIRKRVYFHTDQQSIVDHFGQDMLPDYLGGTLDPEKCIDTAILENFVNYDHYFEEMENNRLPIK